MAGRVVWLVANGYADPAAVLGLTFTRKAAGQLLRRVRTRLARLAGVGPAPRRHADDPARHGQHLPRLRRHAAARARAAAARRTRRPADQRDRAVAVGVSGGVRPPGRTSTPRRALPPSPRWCCGLAGQLAEHLVDTDQLRDTHLELERLVHTLPAGPRSTRPRAQPVAAADAVGTQTERTDLVPLVDALHARMRGRQRHRLRHADGAGRPAGGRVPAGRRAAAAAVPGGAARRVPGHRSCAARRAVVAVRRRGRRRSGSDRGR